MDIIIGREKTTRRLSLTCGTQTKCFGTQGSVPEYVSRQHAKLTIDDKGEYTLTNLNPQNITYVNGISIEQKRITEDDKVEFGPTRYQLNWEFISQMVPKMIDISPLESVWNEYHKTKMKNQIAERKFNALRSATGIITMLAILLGMVGLRGALYYILYGLAIGITLLFAIKAYLSSTKLPKQNEELDKKFKQTYICPNPKCQHFMGYNSFDVLSQNKNCPYCKAQYKKI